MLYIQFNLNHRLSLALISSEEMELLRNLINVLTLMLMPFFIFAKIESLKVFENEKQNGCVLPPIEADCVIEMLYSYNVAKYFLT